MRKRNERALTGKGEEEGAKRVVTRSTHPRQWNCAEDPFRLSMLSSGPAILSCPMMVNFHGVQHGTLDQVAHPG
jgi:hypothetical protein